MLPIVLPSVLTLPDGTSLISQRLTLPGLHITVPDRPLDLCKAGVRGSIPLVSTALTLF